MLYNCIYINKHGDTSFSWFAWKLILIHVWYEFTNILYRLIQSIVIISINCKAIIVVYCVCSWFSCLLCVCFVVMMLLRRHKLIKSIVLMINAFEVSISPYNDLHDEQQNQVSNSMDGTPLISPNPTDKSNTLLQW